MESVAKAAQGGNAQLSVIEPYAELMLRALVSALRYLLPEWSGSGWLTLDGRGRHYLAEEGIGESDLSIAVNEGVRAGLIQRRLVGGCAGIALKERAART